MPPPWRRRGMRRKWSRTWHCNRLQTMKREERADLARCAALSASTRPSTPRSLRVSTQNSATDAPSPSRSTASPAPSAEAKSMVCSASICSLTNPGSARSAPATLRVPTGASNYQRRVRSVRLICLVVTCSLLRFWHRSFLIVVIFKPFQRSRRDVIVRGQPKTENPSLKKACCAAPGAVLF